jgi:hypothetical protein
MLTTRRIRRRRRMRQGLAGALLGLVALAGTVTASETTVSRIGAATVQANGSFGFDALIGEDLINNGQTYAVVTDGACWANPARAIVFEGQLKETESGDGSWAGAIAPVGARSEQLAARGHTEGHVQLIPIDEDTTRVTATLDGMPPDTTLTVCIRQKTDSPEYEPEYEPARLLRLPQLPRH